MFTTARGILVALALVGTSAVVPASDDIQPLVSAQWLSDNMERDNLVVLDIRNAIDGSDRDTYETGHIPGAVYSSYTDDGWRQNRDGVPGLLPPMEDLEGLIGDLGIDNTSQVVIVPAGVGSTDFGSAARVYWTFKVLGHDRVSILNGGHRGWVEAGLPVEEGWNEPVSATFNAEFRPELIADADEVANAPAAGIQLVDNRPSEQYLGRDKHPAARAAGTIPDSLNLQQQQLVKEGTAFMLDADSLRDLMEQAEIDGSGQAITFCNTGHWAALGWFAMSEVAGHPNVAMYDGSMVDWSQDENRPLQTERRGIGGLIDRILN